MARVGAVAALLLALTVVGVSARPGPAVNVNAWAHDIVGALKEWSGATMEVDSSVLEGLGREEGEGKFNLLVKYIVRPSIAKEFIGEVIKVKEEAKSVKGCNDYSISFDLSKNVEYWNYQQWESKKDFFEWIMAKDTEVRKLAEWIESKDVVYTLTQLAPVAFHKEHHHHTTGGTIQRRSGAEVASQPMEVMAEIFSDAAETLQAWVDPAEERAAPAVRREHEHARPFLLSKFIVKPAELEEFVKAAELITDAVEKEEGSIAYGFSKALNDDVTFYNVAMWDSKEAAYAFLKSSAAKKFLKFTLEENIYVQTTVLYPIESHE